MKIFVLIILFTSSVDNDDFGQLEQDNKVLENKIIILNDEVNSLKAELF
tara:strand:- start:746 stop:892 length:147 start_codon:yes stop_codon:yes gene_type:complete